MKAAIDIGSNTVLLLVAEYKNGRLKVRYEGRHTPRLGRGVDRDGTLHPESMQGVIDALSNYRSTLEERFPEVEQVSVTATSAVRDAANRDEFLRRIERETGFAVRILSGKEEAEYTYKGALGVLPGLEGDLAVLDIGGGSTEIAVGKGMVLKDRYSLNMGSVRFTERYLEGNPPGKAEKARCAESVNELLRKHPFSLGERTITVGVAGTVTSLACMVKGLKEDDAKEINGMKLNADTVRNWSRRIGKVPWEELLREYPELMKGRADVFLGGVIILETFMEHFGIPELMVSTGGIRHGAILHQ